MRAGIKILDPIIALCFAGVLGIGAYGQRLGLGGVEAQTIMAVLLCAVIVLSVVNMLAVDRRAIGFLPKDREGWAADLILALAIIGALAVAWNK